MIGNPFEINPNTYSDNTYINATLYVPQVAIDKYKTTKGWCKFKNIAEAPYISFADSNVKAICVAKWDTNGDGELDKAEAAAVTDLGSSAFSYKSNITSFDELQYFTGLTSIPRNTFMSCTKLKSVTIPESVTSIEDRAFSFCGRLTSITIPSSVTSIGTNAFFNCIGLTAVTMGSGIKTIGRGAFSHCPELVDVYCYAETVPVVDDESTFSQSDIEYATLYVPSTAIQNYRAAEVWNDFQSIVPIGGTPDRPQCATPTMSYKNGILLCDCETKGVKYVYSISPQGSSGESSDGRIVLGATLSIDVYAKHKGYLDSETATATIDMAQVGDVNGDGVITIADVTALVNVILGKN